jgi:hypothetical protein
MLYECVLRSSVPACGQLGCGAGACFVVARTTAIVYGTVTSSSLCPLSLASMSLRRCTSRGPTT